MRISQTSMYYVYHARNHVFKCSPLSARVHSSSSDLLFYCACKMRPLIEQIKWAVRKEKALPATLAPMDHRDPTSAPTSAPTTAPTTDTPFLIPFPAAGEFQYSPLFFCSENLRCQIRLVKVLPGDYADPMCCTIFKETLGLAEYEALSYTWGDPKDRRAIRLNGHSQAISITANCEAALRRLRYLDRERVVWIDAICINQGDLMERSRQVRLMADIFRRASCTLCYVGEPDDSSDAALRLLRKVDEYNDWENDEPPVRFGGPNSGPI